MIDADEFMRPLDGRTSITQIVAEYFSDPNVIVMGMNWAIYGSSGRIAPGNGLLLERFTQRVERDFETNRHIKCFIRSEYCPGQSATRISSTTVGPAGNTSTAAENP